MTGTGCESPYDVHGHGVRVRTEDAALAFSAREALGGFGPAPDGGEPMLEIELHAVARRTDVPVRPSAAAVLVGHAPQPGGTVGCAMLRDGARWLLDFDQAGLFALDLNAGRVEGWLVEPGRMAPDWAASFVLLAAIELLRTRGIYAVHGAALEKSGRGVLIAGPSGCGKTTACLALARAGYRVLSDDHPLLRFAAAGPELLPFPGRIAVTERTIGWFPELRQAQDGFRQDTRKRSFDLADVAGYRTGHACRPALLVFPRIMECDRSVLEPLGKARALEELLPQTLLVLDAALAARQFQSMAALVRETPAYRLYFGEDVAALPQRIDRLLEAA